MIFFITEILESRITIEARAEGRGGLIGDAMFEISPDESFLDLSFEDLKALGLGEHSYEE